MGVPWLDLSLTLGAWEVECCGPEVGEHLEFVPVAIGKFEAVESARQFEVRDDGQVDLGVQLVRLEEAHRDGHRVGLYHAYAHLYVLIPDPPDGQFLEGTAKLVYDRHGTWSSPLDDMPMVITAQVMKVDVGYPDANVLVRVA